jgi:hypothetical protein
VPEAGDNIVLPVSAPDRNAEPQERFLDHLIIEPMRRDFMLWRCLHAGPLSPETIDDPAPHPQIDWPSTRARNVPLLNALMETYGTCAIVARDGDKAVGTLRFYPKPLVSSSAEGSGLCLQQAPPAGPRDAGAARVLPPREVLPERTLFVHCLMVVSTPDQPARYRRKGLATRMALELIRWAGNEGWDAIEAHAYEEIPMLYAIAGVAGKRFWEKLGFQVVRSDTEPGMTGEILEAIRRDAEAAGIPADKAVNRYRMRLDLGPG